MWNPVQLSVNEVKKEIRNTGEQLIISKIIPANCCRDKSEEMKLVQLVVYVYGNPKFLSFTKKKRFTLEQENSANMFFEEERKKIDQKYVMLDKLGAPSPQLINQPLQPQIQRIIPQAGNSSPYVARNMMIPNRKPCGSCGGKKR
jgi:hypothetical protein